MKPSVLLIEDDKALCIELSAYLVRVGFTVLCVATLADARVALADFPDLLVVDINLPDGDGLDLCRELSRRDVGVVICTARDERELRIASLRSSVDAYLVKPVDPEELEATLFCVHRRVSASNDAHSPLPWSVPAVQAWQLGPVDRVLISPNGVAVLLSANEYSLLKTLCMNQPHLATHEVLVAQIDVVIDARSARRLEYLVSRLRRKINDKAGIKLPLCSEYGRGYSFSGHMRYGDYES